VYSAFFYSVHPSVLLVSGESVCVFVNLYSPPVCLTICLPGFFTWGSKKHSSACPKHWHLSHSLAEMNFPVRHRFCWKIERFANKIFFVVFYKTSHTFMNRTQSLCSLYNETTLKLEGVYRQILFYFLNTSSSTRQKNTSRINRMYLNVLIQQIFVLQDIKKMSSWYLFDVCIILTFLMA
jgi:hypothetical protein